MKIKIVTRNSKDWNKALNLVTQKYKHTFGADVLPNPDYFVVCVLSSEFSDRDTQIVACAGMTFSSKASFFSEQYLDEPIERIVSRFEGKTVSRNKIVEIGSLASVQNKIGIELVKIVPIITWCMGKEYIFCTVTKQIRRIFDCMELHFEPIQLSEYGRLGESAKEQWGNYYDNLPKTGFIRLSQISSLFSKNTGRYHFSNLEIALTDITQIKASKTTIKAVVSNASL
ncbi:hypothetical protein WA1_25115 [Scytonema hofmannii PCC 7110]|uniref:Thermostable hemolysin n=1 Tax=Scytonema hofmannii PCC 7110 TaxID=128403 RepID=A0A139X867_9CYAN|nr:thermostable hemolysin [Scytonema hofmannii]KYC40901.1 hypothetical protein WA1_25115 [Scytonema hofmannii PCC 7110]